MRIIFSLFAYTFLVFGYSCTKKEYPVDVNFNYETITRKGHFGDNWCQTWASDDNIYTMLDDGNGWWGEKEKSTERIGWEGSMCIQINGNENFMGENVKKNGRLPQKRYYIFFLCLWNIIS